MKAARMTGKGCKMEFEESHPSIDKLYSPPGCWALSNAIPITEIQEHTVDKQRLREVIERYISEAEKEHAIAVDRGIKSVMFIQGGILGAMVNLLKELQLNEELHPSKMPEVQTVSTDKTM